MTNFGRLARFICILPAVAGCVSGDHTTGVTCTEEGAAGVVITLEDSVAAARFPFTDVRAVASEGVYRDTARVASITASTTSARTVGLVFERAGTYSLEVTAAGYAPWRVDGITVAKGAVCGHVIPRAIAARLQHL
jgi:hypothetical protein